MSVPPQLSVGFTTYSDVEVPDPAALVGTAVALDRAGFDRLVVSDHVVFGEDLEAYAGLTIMGDGEVSLILDTTGIARNAGIPKAEDLADEDQSDERPRPEHHHPHSVTVTGDGRAGAPDSRRSAQAVSAAERVADTASTNGAIATARTGAACPFFALLGAPRTKSTTPLTPAMRTAPQTDTAAITISPIATGIVSHHGRRTSGPFIA